MPVFSLLILLILAGGDEPKNPWIAKAPALISVAEDSSKSADLAAGFDAAWRADDWQAGRRLAEKCKQLPDNPGALAGHTARALWRAGRLSAAEEILKRQPEKPDAIWLGAAINSAISRGDEAAALAAGAKLEKLDNLSAADLINLMSVRMVQNRFDDMIPLIRKIESRVDVANGYPETFVEEMIDGLATFFEKSGPAPVNQIAAHGTAPIRVAPIINLPMVDATINGHGPYRFILDTGGSIMISLDREIAAEIGLKTIVSGVIRGVSGKDSAGQALIDECRIGDIVIKRGLARVFDVAGQTAGSCDGILGTGVFGEGRMTIDFAKMSLIIAPSSADPGPGQPLDVRIVGDSKLIVPITIEGRPALGLLDSGADVAALSPASLKELYPSKKFAEMSAPVAGVGSGAAPTISFAEGVDLKIGPREHKKFSGLGLDVLDKTLSPMLGIHIDALLGMPVFRNMKCFTVDLKRCKMWVDWLPE